MALVPKIDPNKIFASNAPTQDKPAAFDNYEKGMDETRKNLGRPTIPQLNYLHQTADQKILWIHQNGGGLPYDASIEYAENAVTLKDGELKQLVDGAWVETKTKSLPATAITAASSQNQQQINDFGGAKWYSKVGGHELGATVKLDNGDTVKSTISNNTANPNVDMTGWVLADSYLNKIKLNRDLISVWDFFTASEYATYKAAPTTFDAKRPIQEFFSKITSEDVGVAYCSGRFKVSSALNLGINGAGVKTKIVIGDFQVTALNAIDTVLQVYCGQDFKWSGSIKVVGTGNTRYENRTCRVGVRIGGEYSSSRSIFGALSASYFSQVGISCNNLTTLTNLGECRADSCGSGLNTPGYSLLTDWGTRVDSGTQSSNSQLSKITVNTLPPENIETNSFIVIGDQPYHIMSVDRANSTISVFPWIDLTLTSGTSARYMFGAGVYVTGSDSSVNKIEKLDAVRCGVGYWTAALYAPIADNVVTQNCGAGVILGNRPEAAMVGGQINGLYCEADNFDIIKAQRAAISMIMPTTYAVNSNKFAYAGAPRETGNKLRRQASGMNGVSISQGGYVCSFEAFGGNFVLSTAPVDVTSPNRATDRYYSNAKTYDIQVPNISLNTAFGYDYKCVIQFGSGVNAAPTGVSTFNAPAGYTVNGGASATLSGFIGAAIFVIYLNFATNDFIVSCSSLVVTNVASVTYDPPSLAATGTTGDSTTTTVTLTGVALGSVVQAAFSRYNAGIEISAQVSAANTVTVKFKNTTANPIDLASGTLTVKSV